jgi:hypothetical protein
MCREVGEVGRGSMHSRNRWRDVLEQVDTRSMHIKMWVRR